MQNMNGCYVDTLYFLYRREQKNHFKNYLIIIRLSVSENYRIFIVYFQGRSFKTISSLMITSTAQHIWQCHIFLLACANHYFLGCKQEMS